MEYLANGNLKEYLHAHHAEISTEQRLRWARQAAEGLSLLHEEGILHCDVSPRNFLLDAKLELKIADFGGSSVDGKRPNAFAGGRYVPPNFDWREPPTVRDDLFAVGSTIYHVMTGQKPFPELASEDV